MMNQKTILKKYNIKSIDFYQAGDCDVFTDNIYFCGCDLRCYYCHNKELWDEVGTEYTLDELLKKLDESDNQLVAYMGGEPCTQNINPLTFALHKRNKKVVLFTASPNPWISFAADYYHVDVKLFSHYIYLRPPSDIKITYGLVSTGRYLEVIEQKFENLHNEEIYFKYGKTVYGEQEILKQNGIWKLHLNERIKLI